jgi:hypothetical protein
VFLRSQCFDVHGAHSLSLLLGLFGGLSRFLALALMSA